MTAPRKGNRVDDPPQYTDDDAPPGDNVTPLPTKTRPAHLDAEQALLGALVRAPEHYPKIAQIIAPGDFDEPRHQIIWDAMTAVWERDAVPPDSALLLPQLQRAGDFAKVASLLPNLTAANPDAAHAYAREVHEAAGRRDLLARFNTTIHRIKERPPTAWPADLAELYQTAHEAVQALTGHHPSGLHADLTWLRSGQAPHVDPPTYVRRADGNALFYPARVNGIFGDPETAKSWIAQVAIVEALAAGQRAALVDVDHNGANLTTERLLLLGATVEQLADPNLFRYCEPTDGLDLLATITQLVTWKPAVAVLDSIGEIMPMLGIKSVDNDELSTGLRQTATALADAGACVITVDHLPKSHEARTSGFAIGGTAKKRAMDGAYIHADAKVPPSPGGIGRIILRIEKDRPGRLRATCGGKYVGTFTLDSTNAGAITTSITNEAPPTTDDGGWRPTHLMERISRFVEENPGSSKNLIEISVKGKATHKRQALELLILDAYIEVTKGANRAQEHHPVKPYREGDEDRD